jgi:hypothetical protein
MGLLDVVLLSDILPVRMVERMTKSIQGYAAMQTLLMPRMPLFLRAMGNFKDGFGLG